ncbi:MAG: hypothetical protein ACTHK7_19215 [Aureliella sp.]
MSAAEIETWFQQCVDGEFTLATTAIPLIHSGMPVTAQSIVYCTKPHCLGRLRILERLPAPYAVIGRYGLPLGDRLDEVWGTTLGSYFVGDADPVDLFIFAWLRAQRDLQWIGLSDDFLLGQNTDQLNRITVPLSKAEADAVARLPLVCPDYRELLGPYCSSLLDSGCKIELEGAIITLQESSSEK